MKVICTHFMRKGLIEKDLWLAGHAYAKQYASPITVRGYHAWAVPYVRLMRTSPLAERIMLPIIRVRSEEIGYVMGIRPHGTLAGKLARLTLEPFSFLVGLFVGEQNWQSLWVGFPPVKGA